MPTSGKGKLGAHIPDKGTSEAHMLRRGVEGGACVPEKGIKEANTSRKERLRRPTHPKNGEAHASREGT